MLVHRMTRRTPLSLFLFTLVAFGASIALLVPVAHGATPAPAPAADCQPYSSTPCLLPFPNNLFTRRDRSTPTGRRVNLPAAAMPVNQSGQQIGVAEYDRNDGFSPGSAVIVHIAGLDNPQALANTGAVQLTNMAQAYAHRQPIVIIDAATGQPAADLGRARRQSRAPPQDTDLLIHPGEELRRGPHLHRRAARPA